MKTAVKGFALVAMCVFGSLNAMAAEGFGMAGCGLGSMIIESNGKEQIFVATTNGTSGSQTFGITSGTSNCRDDAATVAAMYISVNEEALKRDISRGNGETIEGLASVLNCSDSAALGKSLQKNYTQIFTGASDSYVIANQLRQSVYTDTNLNSSCKSAI